MNGWILIVWPSDRIIDVVGPRQITRAIGPFATREEAKDATRHYPGKDCTIDPLHHVNA